MKFENNTIYHIYNQGNNKGQIFFKEENYLFFLKKIRLYVIPHCEVLCYCLMPNHFHFLVYVKEALLDIREEKNGIVKQVRRTLNDSLAIMLRSYTRAINLQENRTGALFREGTKAKDGIIEGFVTVKNKEALLFGGEMNYEATCFRYIHENPVHAKLVKCPTDWIYSSALDYAGLRNGKLCNQELAKSLGII